MFKPRFDPDLAQPPIEAGTSNSLKLGEIKTKNGELKFRRSEASLPLCYQSSPFPVPCSPLDNIPVWNDELYLEFHRGCYTTHADQKRWNRRCERLLYQAELFASLATLTTGVAYPKVQLEQAWKKVLFNQLHDILPGTSIPEVFVEANLAWQDVEQVGSEILQESLKAIASQIALPSPPQPDAQPIIIFNPLNWQRSEFVSVSLPISANSQAVATQKASVSWEIYDFSGEKIPSQLSETSMLLFLANDVPSILCLI